MDRYPKRRNPVAAKGISDIVWSGDSQICNNQLKHYQAFCINGVTIKVHSFVLVNVKRGVDHVAYVGDLYEDQRGKKWVRVRWFYFPREIKKFVTDLVTDEQEIFLAPVEEVVSAECINGVAVVLTPDHLDKYAEVIGRDYTSECYCCHRQFTDQQLEPFCLTQLHGYSTQFSLSTFQLNPAEQGNDFAPLTPEMPEAEPTIIFKTNENLDFHNQGYWCLCKILESTRTHLRVEYSNVDGPGKVQEWILATSDELGMSYAGRCPFEVGTAVDVWMEGGWWEGVLIARCVTGEDSFIVNISGKNRLGAFERKNTRISKDRIDPNPQSEGPPILAEDTEVVEEPHFKKRLLRKYQKEVAAEPHFKKRLLSKYQEEVANRGGNGDDGTMN